MPVPGRAHLLTTVPAAAYVAAHLLALRDPAGLWGADLLNYYAAPAAVAFVAVPIAMAVVHGVGLSVPVPGCHARLARLARRLESLPGAAVATVGSLALFYLLRVRSHHLGDSQEWFM